MLYHFKNTSFKHILIVDVQQHEVWESFTFLKPQTATGLLFYSVFKKYKVFILDLTSGLTLELKVEIYPLIWDDKISVKPFLPQVKV